VCEGPPWRSLSFSVVPEQGEQDDNWKRYTKQPQEGASTEAHVNLLSTIFTQLRRLSSGSQESLIIFSSSTHPGSVQHVSKKVTWASPRLCIHADDLAHTAGRAASLLEQRHPARPTS